MRASRVSSLFADGDDRHEQRVGGESRTLDYAYDLLGSLTTVTAGDEVVEAYAYDANGNRTHATVPARGVDATMTFDAADRIATSDQATYTTDADGFVTSKETSAGTTTYRYSALGELTTVTVPSGHTITYAYDAFSRRVSRSVDGTLTDRYLWADATHLLAVYPATGTTPVYRFAYADGRVPTSVETSAGTLRLLTDQVGTVRALVASDGTITSRVERDSYGAITSGTADFPLGFAGGLEDADTGLVHFGAREYDPSLGRWLSRDPIDFAGGDANLYGYVLGDPIAWADWWGLAARDGTPFGRYNTVILPSCPTDESLAWDTIGTVLHQNAMVLGMGVGVAAGTAVGPGGTVIGGAAGAAAAGKAMESGFSAISTIKTTMDWANGQATMGDVGIGIAGAVVPWSSEYSMINDIAYMEYGIQIIPIPYVHH